MEKRLRNSQYKSRRSSPC